jgi:hypothetical protein
LAYNPGVTNISGQILAQGVNSAAGSLADSIKQYSQNKILSGQSVAKFEAAIKADPAMLQLFQSEQAPQEAAKAFAKLTKEGTVGLKDAAVLAQFADGYTQHKKEQQDMALKNAQAQEAQARGAQFAEQVAASKREQADRDRAARMLADAFMPKQGQSEMGQAIGAGAKFEQLGGMSTKPGAAVDPSIMEVVRKVGQSGVPITPEVERFLNHTMNAQTREDAIRARGVRPALDLEKGVRSTDEKGNPIEVTYDKTTGKEFARGPIQKPPVVPDPLVNSMYQDFSRERNERVLPALASLEAYDNIERIMGASPGLFVNGKLANAELFVKQVANSLGMKNVDVANSETIRSLFAVPVAQIIKNFGAGTGLSDADREFAIRASGGDLTLTEESIRRLVKIGKIASENVRKNFDERLDSAFPEDTENPSYRQIRKALRLPKAATAFAAAAAEPTVSKSQSILDKYGIK